MQPGGSRAQDYRANGYVLLDKLFSPVVLSIFHGKLQSDLNLRGDPAFVSQTWLHTKPALEVYSRGYAPMATFHWGLTPTAAAIAGCDLVPTYAYFRVYQQDDICVIHADRPACEHSISLTIELADNHPWALCVGKEQLESPSQRTNPAFDSDEAFTELPMRAGDAVMYRGVTHRHGRIEPNPNRWSAHLFLHWVEADGQYADHAFDRVAVEKAKAGNQSAQ